MKSTSYSCCRWYNRPCCKDEIFKLYLLQVTKQPLMIVYNTARWSFQITPVVSDRTGPAGTISIQIPPVASDRTGPAGTISIQITPVAGDRAGPAPHRTSWLAEGDVRRVTPRLPPPGLPDPGPHVQAAAAHLLHLLMASLTLLLGWQCGRWPRRTRTLTINWKTPAGNMALRCSGLACGWTRGFCSVCAVWSRHGCVWLTFTDCWGLLCLIWKANWLHVYVCVCITTRRETVNIFQVLTTSMVKAEWGGGGGGGGGGWAWKQRNSMIMQLRDKLMSCVYMQKKTKKQVCCWGHGIDCHLWTAQSQWCRAWCCVRLPLAHLTR